MRRAIRIAAYITFAVLLVIAVWITFTPVAITETQFYLYCAALLVCAALIFRED